MLSFISLIYDMTSCTIVRCGNLTSAERPLSLGSVQAVHLRQWWPTIPRAQCALLTVSAIWYLMKSLHNHKVRNALDEKDRRTRVSKFYNDLMLWK